MAVGDNVNYWTLFENETGVSVNSIEATLNVAGDKYLFIDGTFDGNIVTAYMKSPGSGAFVKIDGGDFTEPLVKLLKGIPKSATIRLTITGTGTSDITAELTK